MSGHDDQVEAPVRLVALRRGLDPLNLFRVRFASSHSQHRRCWINTRHPVTTFGEGTAEHARTATQVEDTTWAQSGEGRGRSRYPAPTGYRGRKSLRAEGADSPYPCRAAAKASHSRFYGCGAKEWKRGYLVMVERQSDSRRVFAFAEFWPVVEKEYPKFFDCEVCALIWKSRSTLNPAAPA